MLTPSSFSKIIDSNTEESWADNAALWYTIINGFEVRVCVIYFNLYFSISEEVIDPTCAASMYSQRLEFDDDPFGPQHIIGFF